MGRGIRHDYIGHVNRFTAPRLQRLSVQEGLKNVRSDTPKCSRGVEDNDNNNNTFFDILLTVHLNIFILILTNLMH